MKLALADRDRLDRAQLHFRALAGNSAAEGDQALLALLNAQKRGHDLEEKSEASRQALVP
jgi:hypothetical protein